MNADDRRRAVEQLKDLIVEQKRSRWPKIVGVTIVLMMLGGVACWFYLPPNERPPLENLEARLRACVHAVLNTPVSGSASAPASPTQPPNKSAPAGDDTGLLSN